MFDVTNFNDSNNKTSNNLSIFLARVGMVYVDDKDFKVFEKKDGQIQDTIIIHNDNDKIVDTDTRYYGAISFKQQDTLDDSNAFTAYPFDKNNFTLPLVGETVIVIEMENEWFYLPYSKTLYPNYRNDYKTSQKLDQGKVQKTDTKSTASDYSKVSKTGISSTTNASAKDTDIKYNINEKIKFLKPRKGDTILTGRVGNTIRFSEFFLTDDSKTSSPSIFIRNKQNPKLDSEKIGTLVDEDINKDGTSIYITSNKVKVPFKETINKVKIAFKDFPSSDKLKGDQLFINSDRIVLSAKASEFIIFGKGNTGILTDGKFSVDSIGDSHIHSDNNVILQTKKNIVLASDDVGTIWLGGVKKTKGKAGESYQRMVLAGELIQILEELIDEITKIIVPTPVGPSGTPINAAVFKAIKGKLPKIQSARNFLSKS